GPKFAVGRPVQTGLRFAQVGPIQRAFKEHARRGVIGQFAVYPDWNRFASARQLVRLQAKALGSTVKRPRDEQIRLAVDRCRGMLVVARPGPMLPPTSALPG